MILRLHNLDGLCYAIFEWDVVDEKGRRQEHGEYMYVRDIWVHKNYKGKEVIGTFIKMLNEDNRNRNVKYIYWLRNDVRLSRAFRRGTCLRRINDVYFSAT